MRPQTKQVIAIAQVSTTNAATATGVIDTLGFSYCSIDTIMATSNAVSNNPTVFDLLESDDTVVTNAVTVSGFIGDTDWTIPNCVTSGNYGIKFNVDCRGRKRYLRVRISPLTTQVITCIANLSLGEQSADDTTSAGVKAIVEG